MRVFIVRDEVVTDLESQTIEQQKRRILERQDRITAGDGNFIIKLIPFNLFECCSRTETSFSFQ